MQARAFRTYAAVFAICGASAGLLGSWLYPPTYSAQSTVPLPAPVSRSATEALQTAFFQRQHAIVFANSRGLYQELRNRATSYDLRDQVVKDLTARPLMRDGRIQAFQIEFRYPDPAKAREGMLDAASFFSPAPATDVRQGVAAGSLSRSAWTVLGALLGLALAAMAFSRILRWAVAIAAFGAFLGWQASLIAPGRYASGINFVAPNISMNADWPLRDENLSELIHRYHLEPATIARLRRDLTVTHDPQDPEVFHMDYRNLNPRLAQTVIFAATTYMTENYFMARGKTSDVQILTNAQIAALPANIHPASWAAGGAILALSISLGAAIAASGDAKRIS